MREYIWAVLKLFMLICMFVIYLIPIIDMRNILAETSEDIRDFIRLIERGIRSVEREGEVLRDDITEVMKPVEDIERKL